MEFKAINVIDRVSNPIGMYGITETSPIFQVASASNCAPDKSLPIARSTRTADTNPVNNKPTGKNSAALFQLVLCWNKNHSRTATMAPDIRQAIARYP
ncbi:hypothetical protein [Labrenzia sp. DG1229]|uniref:hypothetical protein n=1 Tax=Labrenzia sp. DG1229 TaxID=681847 RepID=UPI0012EC1397|nr:hypothetical protein [Labrenzia sp. DG1229]